MVVAADVGGGVRQADGAGVRVDVRPGAAACDVVVKALDVGAWAAADDVVANCRAGRDDVSVDQLPRGDTAARDRTDATLEGAGAARVVNEGTAADGATPLRVSVANAEIWGFTGSGARTATWEPDDEPP